MENKDYKRLTDTGIPITNKDVCMRLFELENAIENGTLFFLPCKVGESVWHIQHNLTIEEAVVDNVEVLCDGDTNVRVHFVNVQAGTTFRGNTMGRYYFTTKEAAEKELKRLKK